MVFQLTYIPFYAGIFAVLVIIFSAIKIIREYERAVIFRLGRLDQMKNYKRGEMLLLCIKRVLF